MFRCRIVILSVMLAAILMLPPITVRAQDENLKTIDGRIVSVDPQGSTIVVKAAENMIFSVSSGASLTNQDGLDIELSDMSPGNYIMIGYYDNRSGTHIAKSVNVEYNK